MACVNTISTKQCEEVYYASFRAPYVYGASWRMCLSYIPVFQVTLLSQQVPVDRVVPPTLSVQSVLAVLVFLGLPVSQEDPALLRDLAAPLTPVVI